jgi:ATP-binding cassette, subfamily F, member 2
VSGVTVNFHGKPLIEETDVIINYGNRYGFIGPNGSGKVRIIYFGNSKGTVSVY